MRRIALVFLLFLSLYALRKNLHWEIKGLEIALSPLTLRVAEVYISYDDFLLHLKDLSLWYEGGVGLYISDGALVVAGGEERNGAAPEIPAFLRDAEIKIENFHVVFLGEEELSVVIEDLSLKDRVLGFSANLSVRNVQTCVRLQRARLLEKGVAVLDMSVSSEFFEFSAVGDVSGERASFSLKGFVRELEREGFRINPVEVEGEGVLSYGGLRARFRGWTDSVDIEGRTRFEGVEITGDIGFQFGESLIVRGDISDGSVYAIYELELLPERRITLRIDKLPVDAELLGVDVAVVGWVSGEVRGDLRKKEIELLLRSHALAVEGVSVGDGFLWLSYGMRSRQGKVEVLVPGLLVASGSIGEGSFGGRFRLEDLFIARKGASFFLSYEGEALFGKKPYLKGRGKVSDLHYGNLPVGDVSFELELLDRDLEAVYRGEGFLGWVRGTIGEELLVFGEMRGMRREMGGVSVEVSRGEAELVLRGERFELSLSVEEMSLGRGETSASLHGWVQMEGGDALVGEYYLEVVGLTEEKLILGGRIEGSELVGTYGAGETLEGDFTLSLKERRLRTNGRFGREGMELLYLFEGTPSRGELTARLSVNGAPLTDGRFSYRGREIFARVNPFEYSAGAVRVRFRGLEAKGSLGKALIGMNGLEVYIMDSLLGKLSQVEGYLSVAEKEVRWKGELSGAVEGEVILGYRESPYINSRGTVDLRRLSFLIATPTGGRAEGKLFYELAYDGERLDLSVKNDGKVLAYIRHLNLPMEAWVDLRAVGRTLGAFITLWNGDRGISANVGSLNLRDYYAYIILKSLPVIYRTEGLTLSLNLSSEGWVDVRKLKEVKLRADALLSGDVIIGKVGLGKGQEKRKGPALELDLRFESERPVRVVLPEGYVYVNVSGWVLGRAEDPDYGIRVEFLSGELKYFGRRFFVRGGVLTLLKEKEREKRRIDLSFVSPSEELNIFINLRGELEDPKLVVWSEPPRSTGELLTKLIVGGTAEGVLPVAEAVLGEFLGVGGIRRALTGLLGVEITFSTVTGTQGEIGFNVNVRKKIAQAFSVEYQQSTLKDPWETFYGVSFPLSGGAFIYGRVFSDNTSEVKLRFLRKFDF